MPSFYLPISSYVYGCMTRGKARLVDPFSDIRYNDKAGVEGY